MVNERYAVIRDGVVENVVVWDGESDWSPPEGALLVQSDEAGPGDGYDGKAFTRPEPAPADPPQPTIEEKYAALLAVVTQLAPDVVAADPILAGGEEMPLGEVPLVPRTA